MNSYSILKAAVVCAVAMSGAARADVITLNFEGIATYPANATTSILDYYNGGTASNGASGPNLGVSFTAGAQLLCLNSLATVCSNTSKGGLGVPGSNQYAMFFSTTNPFMNVAAGFDTGFAFAYTNPFAAVTTVSVYSGLNGSGTLLASVSLPATPAGATACPGYAADYCPFVNSAVAFNGIARSVLFGGSVNAQTFDDFTFGSTVVGGIPEPASWAVMVGGFGIAGGALRQRRAARLRYAA